VQNEFRNTGELAVMWAVLVVGSGCKLMLRSYSLCTCHLATSLLKVISDRDMAPKLESLVNLICNESNGEFVLWLISHDKEKNTNRNGKQEGIIF
jgi:hypothetical protein